MRLNVTNCVIGILALIMLLIIGCDFGPTNPLNETGSVKINITERVSRSILPDISMDPTSYRIKLTGPDGLLEEQIVNIGEALFEDLRFGAWEVQVVAYNSADISIGHGEQTVEVYPNETSQVQISVIPYEGFGSLDLEILWEADEVSHPEISANLTPSSGTARELEFTLGSANAHYFADDVPTGYHTLIIQLLDNGFLVSGAVEVVRIIDQQTSAASLEFYDINQATGVLDISINTDLQNPLEVSISGAGETKLINESMELTASVEDYSENIVYVWYINGEAVGAGIDFTLGDALPIGYYNVDVTAFSIDGKQAGSANAKIQIVDSINLDFNDASNYTFLPSSYGRYLKFWEDYAFVVDHNQNNALLVFDISNPDSPQLLQTHSRIPGVAWHNICIIDGYIYAANSKPQGTAEYSTVSVYRLESNGELQHVDSLIFTARDSGSKYWSYIFEDNGFLYVFDRNAADALMKYSIDQSGSLSFESEIPIPNLRTPDEFQAIRVGAGNFSLSWRFLSGQTYVYRTSFYSLAGNIIEYLSTLDNVSKAMPVLDGYFLLSANYDLYDPYTDTRIPQDISSYDSEIYANLRFGGHPEDSRMRGIDELLFRGFRNPETNSLQFLVRKISENGVVTVIADEAEVPGNHYSIVTAKVYRGRVYFTSGST